MRGRALGVSPNLGVEAAVFPFSGGLNFLTLPKRPKERGTACPASPSISDQGSAFRAADVPATPVMRRPFSRNQH